MSGTAKSGVRRATGAAELNAATDWDEQFLADLRSNFQRYGAHTYLSDAQLEQLERIANE